MTQSLPTTPLRSASSEIPKALKFVRTFRIQSLVVFFYLHVFVFALFAAPESIRPRAASASSEQDRYPASKAIDGKVSDESRWVSIASNEAWLVVDLGAKKKLAGVHLFTGYGQTSAITSFELQQERDGKWITIPSAVIAGNKATALSIPFDATTPVETAKLRLLIKDSHQGTARVKELVVWPGEAGAVPALPKGGSSGELVCPIPHTAIVPIYLNQSGFNAGKPKRFSCPTLSDGMPFEVRPVAGKAPLFKGVIRGNKGDFSSFEPDDDREYVVVAAGLTSVPFRVGPYWFERTIYQNAVNFMIDSRHHVGNDRNLCGGSFGWRDDHHFGWELHSLVPQYLSNPSAYERMPSQVQYEAPRDKKLWGALAPFKEDAPDIVKLIHWGADIIVTQKLTHEHLKAQLAYFLYAWPLLEKWLPRQNFVVVSEFARAQWDSPKKDHTYPYDESPENNLLALKTRIGSTKGSYPPGFSVEPNLLMYEVSLREARPDAERYLQAARAQVEWMVKNLDWENPLVTKGQRMSEFLTITGLSHFLRQYPAQAPAGLKQKINDWAKVVIRRSNNMWDFRRLNDADGWTPMGEKPQMWNEPGNITGFPAALLAAYDFISPDLQPRIKEIIWSHIDNFSGRNPVGRHFCFHASKEIEGVEYGWFNRYPGGIGRLRDARFVIDGSPKNQHYPYHPEIGNVGWTEGWIQFNTPLNTSLSYLAWSETSLDLKREGQDLLVRLQAPLNFDYAKSETGTVVVTSAQGDHERLMVTETGPRTGIFIGRIPLRSQGSTALNDGALQFQSGTSVQISHGYGYWGRSVKFKP
ncbi:MAG: discoidin domain-containing protein [Akkermansiaceae bacterium]